MRNIACFIIAVLTVSFVLVVGELGRQKVENHERPDYQAYSRKSALDIDK